MASIQARQVRSATLTASTRRSARLVLPLLLLLVLALPPAAEGAWSSPFRISPANTDQHFGMPRVALDAEGDAVFAWEHINVIDCCGFVQARARPATGTLGPIKTLSDSSRHASGAEVGVDADGDALVVWRRYDETGQCGGSGCGRIQARARSAAGTFGPVQTLSDAGQDASSPKVALDPAGNAVVVWERSDGSSASCCTRVQARARSAGGTLGPVQTLSAPGQDAFGAGVGVEADGDALVTWARKDGSAGCGGSGGCARVQARPRSAAGTLGPVQTLSGASANAHSPKLAVNADGDAVVVWARTTTPCGGSSCNQIQARARTASGTLSPAQPISLASQGARLPQVAIDAAGRAVVVWERFDPSSCCRRRVHARARSAAGTLSPVQVLSADADDAENLTYPEVAVDATGNAVFLWQRFDRSSSSCCIRVQTRTRSVTGTLGPVETISPPGIDSGLTDEGSQLAIDPDGHAVAVWTSWTGAGVLRALAATGP